MNSKETKFWLLFFQFILTASLCFFVLRLPVPIFKLVSKEEGNWELVFRNEENTRGHVIEIKNEGSNLITGQLEFNKSLFPNKEAILEYIRSGNPKDNPLPVQFGNENVSKLPVETDYLSAFNFQIQRSYHHNQISNNYGKQSWITSPMLFFNSFGYGVCGIHERVLSKVWKELGYETREWHLNGHAVSEVKNRDSWHLFDSDKRVYFFRKDGMIAGVEYLKNNLDTVFPHTKAVIYEMTETHERMPQSEATLGIREVLEKSEGVYFKTIQTEKSDFDWIPLKLSLPPKSRFIFPFAGGGYVPSLLGLDQLKEYGLRALFPTQSMALLEIPPNSDQTISVGLFPYKVECECEIDLLDDEKPISPQEFNQIDKYWDKRKFVKEMRFLNAKGPIRIFYLLNNSARLKKSNKIRIINKNDSEKGLRDLKVRILKAKLPFRHEEPKVIGISRFLNSSLEVKPVGVSSPEKFQNELGPPKNIIDGKINLVWFSSTIPTVESREISGLPELIFDFGAPKLIGRIAWLPHYTLEIYRSLVPEKIRIFTSTDGGHFNHLFDWNISLSPNEIHLYERAFSSVSAQYIKFQMLPRPHPWVSGKSQSTIAEVKFFTN